MAANVPETIELRNRMYVLPQRQRRWLRASLWILIALPILAIAAFAFLAPPVFDWGGVADRIGRAVARDPWHASLFVLAAVASVLQLAYLQLAIRRERLVLTESGIRYESPLPQALQFLQPDWALRWSELSRARLVKSTVLSGPQAAVLVLETVYGARKLKPFQWVDPATYVAQSPWQLMRQASAMRGAQLEQVIADSPLIRFVATRFARLEIPPGWASSAAAYRLEKSPRAVAVAGTFAGLVLYALADAYLNTETYAGAPPYFVFAAGGVLAGGLAWVWLRAGDVPPTERSIVALLFGCALGAALHPGLLRLNQATDRAGLQTYRYVLRADLTLAPERAGPPALSFPRDAEYWKQFPQGSAHDFRLRRGGLRFYQIDMAPVNEALRRYYHEHK